MADFIGAGEVSTYPPLYFIDNIDVSSFCKGGIIEKAADIYASGLSLKQTAQMLNVAKSTVRKTLIQNGVPMRADNRRLNKADIGVTNYGYVRVDGKLVEDPREQKNIRIMISYWQSGKSFNAISKLLNEQGIKPRVAAKWDNGTVRKIILRQQFNNKNTEEKSCTLKN